MVSRGLPWFLVVSRGLPWPPKTKRDLFRCNFVSHLPHSRPSRTVFRCLGYGCGTKHKWLCYKARVLQSTNGCATKRNANEISSEICCVHISRGLPWPPVASRCQNILISFKFRWNFVAHLTYLTRVLFVMEFVVSGMDGSMDI